MHRAGELWEDGNDPCDPGRIKGKMHQVFQAPCSGEGCWCWEGSESLRADPARCWAACAPSAAQRGWRQSSSWTGMMWDAVFSFQDTNSFISWAGAQCHGLCTAPTAGIAEAQNEQGSGGLCHHSCICIYHISTSTVPLEITSCLCMRALRPKSPSVGLLFFFLTSH